MTAATGTTPPATGPAGRVRADLDVLRDAVAATDAESIAAAVELLLSAYHRAATVFVIGNGGSASTAAHFAADLGKYATGGAPGFRALDLVSNISAVTAWTNDEGWPGLYVNQLRHWLRPGDVVAAFSVHGAAKGWSDNLGLALEHAHAAGAHTIGFSGAGGGRFAEVCDVSIVVPTVPDDLVTPLTESLHVAYLHVICARLRAELSRP